MKRILFGLLALAVTAGFAAAQEPAPKEVTDTVWVIQISGIKG